MVRPLDPIDLVITGPTASGKSRLAISWAKKFDAEIISADSRQIYREISIGTGKPSVEERESVPHHLFDLCPVTVTYSAGDFVRDAREVIKRIQREGKRIVLCGGTGLYIEALLKGLVALPDRATHYEVFRKSLGEFSTPSLYAKIAHADPVRAQSIHPNDRVRILRALYLFEEFKTPPTELYERFRGDGVRALRIVGLDPGREILAGQISQRVSLMLREGWIAEVEDLLRIGVPPDSPGFNSLGYREIIDCLLNKVSWEGLESRIVTKTRQYAKRQMTWFRHMDNLTWISPSETGSFSLEPPPNYDTIKQI